MLIEDSFVLPEKFLNSPSNPFEQSWTNDPRHLEPAEGEMKTLYLVDGHDGIALSVPCPNLPSSSACHTFDLGTMPPDD
jgi:hypothetical protein